VGDTFLCVPLLLTKRNDYDDDDYDDDAAMPVYWADIRLLNRGGRCVVLTAVALGSCGTTTVIQRAGVAARAQ
jgi:hypothetical protein